MKIEEAIVSIQKWYVKNGKVAQVLMRCAVWSSQFIYIREDE